MTLFFPGWYACLFAPAVRHNTYPLGTIQSINAVDHFHMVQTRPVRLVDLPMAVSLLPHPVSMALCRAKGVKVPLCLKFSAR